jgi:hypothetical protein
VDIEVLRLGAKICPDHSLITEIEREREGERG